MLFQVQCQFLEVQLPMEDSLIDLNILDHFQIILFLPSELKLGDFLHMAIQQPHLLMKIFMREGLIL